MNKETIQTMRDSGDTIKAISDFFGEPYRYMRRYMISLGIIGDRDASQRYNKKRVEENKEIIRQVKQMYHEGKKTSEIAELLGIKVKTLLALIKNKGAVEGVRMYNGIVTDYGDGTRQCMKCKTIIKKGNSLCPNCMK